MADGSRIEWTEATWNPTTGCDRSPRVRQLLRATLAKRLKAMGNPKYQADGDSRTSGPGFASTGHPRHGRPETLVVATRDLREQHVRLFHARVSSSFIRDVFQVMEETPRHTYQLLTKRPRRAARMAGDLPWPSNVWLGVSVETAEQSGVWMTCGGSGRHPLVSAQPDPGHWRA